MPKKVPLKLNYKFLKKEILIFLIFSVFIVIPIIIFIYWQSKHIQSQEEREGSTSVISGTFKKSEMKTDAEWKKLLTPEQYYILRQQGTEVPFTGVLEYEHRKGTYFSVGCNEPIFRSEQKYDSGTGWPSFWASISNDALVLREDNTLPGETRIEVLDKCGGHLGHVFDDGPRPTGKRYCINSAAMYFVPDKNQN